MSPDTKAKAKPKAKKETKMCPYLKKPCLENDCMAWKNLISTESIRFWDCVILASMENQATPFKV